jgi:type 1 glutamine amidotransferase
MYRRFFAALCTLLVFGVTTAQPLPDLRVEAGPYDRFDTPVCVSLPDSLAAYGDRLRLREVDGGEETDVPYQWEADRLCFLLTGSTEAQTQRYYRFVVGERAVVRPVATIERSDSAVAIRLAGTQVLSWRLSPKPVPEGVDPIYSRSGFVHPLRTPAGAVLTRIQPPDHYHHYGLWNPWTRTEHRGVQRDFWNLKEGDGTVANREAKATYEGPVYAGLTAGLDYLAFPDSAVTDRSERLLDEELQLRLYPTAHPDRYLLDYRSTQTNLTDDPFTVRAYRYQGFGLRARADWDDESATLLTSEGYGKADGNATRARWLRVEGPTEGGRAGILFLGHPQNYDSPQLIRNWPEGANGGKENVFVNFNPAQERDLPYRPGGSYRQQYRMVVYDGTLDSLTAERYWRDFARPPQVIIENGNLTGKRVLVYTRNGKGYVHQNIPASIAALRQLGREHGFTVVATEDAGVFTEAELSEYDVLVFSNTNNDIFATPEQEAAFRDYVAGGGGFVGIHSASGSERDADWFARILGGRFHRHAKRQDFDVAVVDYDHPSTDFLPPTWHIRDDECYYLKRLNPAMHVLLAADLTTVTDSLGKADYPADTFGDRFPVSWCHAVGRGRSWYTSLGHRDEHYRDPLFLRHILGGIRWAAGE